MVVAIIGIMVAVAAPTFRFTEQRHSLRTGTADVQQMIQLARAQAVATRTFVAVEFDLQVYPLPDRIRVIQDAQWDTGLSRWQGTEMAGGVDLLLEVPLDMQELRVGATTYLTGVHSIAFSPTGTCAVDDGSISGAIELDIVRMDSYAALLLDAGSPAA